MTIGVLFVCTANIAARPWLKACSAPWLDARASRTLHRLVGRHDQSMPAGATPAAIEAAGRRGYDIQASARARSREGAGHRDYVLAMDRSHMADLRWLAPRTGRPAADVHQVRPMPVILDVQDRTAHRNGLRARARPDRGRLQGPPGRADGGGHGGDRRVVVAEGAGTMFEPSRISRLRIDDNRLQLRSRLRLPVVGRRGADHPAVKSVATWPS